MPNSKSNYRDGDAFTRLSKRSGYRSRASLKLKEILKSNDIDYDEYIIQSWPSPIPEFDVPDNIFILRYSYDEYSKIDQLASSSYSFKSWIEKSYWSGYYKKIESEEVVRVTVFCSMIENFILKGRTYKMLFKK